MTNGEKITLPPPTPANHAPGGLAFATLEARGISAHYNAEMKDAQDTYDLQLERIQGGYDAQMKPHHLMLERNRERAQAARWKAWRYYAALWIAIDALFTVLALYYAVTHGARLF